MSYHIRVNGRGIVIHNDHILLNEFGNGDYYNIPGGGVEPGETVKQAIEREIFEESGLRVSVGDLIYVLEYEPAKCKYLYGNTPQLSVVFRCHLNGDDTINQQPIIPDFDPEHPEIKSKAKWIPISKLKDIHYVPYIHEQLIQYMVTNHFSPIFIEEPLQKK